MQGIAADIALMVVVLYRFVMEASYEPICVFHSDSNPAAAAFYSSKLSGALQLRDSFVHWSVSG